MQFQELHDSLTRPLLSRAPVASQAERLLVSAAEAAHFLGVSLRKFQQLRKTLPEPVLLGARVVRWRRADLVAWVAALGTAGARSEPPQLAASRDKRRAGAGTAGDLTGTVSPQPRKASNHAGDRQTVFPSNPTIEPSPRGAE
jgi:predicted DNA-binding transcriptional regulator AlpA